MLKRFSQLFLSVFYLSGGVSLFAYEPEERFRRPIALALMQSGPLVVANRDAGSVSLVNPAEFELVFERKVGQRMSDVKAIPDSRYLVATDEEASELLLLEALADDVKIIRRSPAPHSRA